MAREQFIREPTPKDGIEIIGSGSVGEKLGQLVEKTPQLHRIGFDTPRRTVFAEGFFDSFFRRNGLGPNLCQTPESEDLVNHILNGTFPLAEFETISGVARSFGDVPLVIRSSAVGDARGTGIYKSVFTDTHPGNVRKAVQEVLASYFTNDAIQFRRDARTGEGFAIDIEPAIGSWVHDEYGSGYFTPLLSGFGYTSTPRDQSGYITVVPGLGGGVETRNGERISGENSQFLGELGDYIYLERNKILNGREPNRNSSLVGVHGMRGDIEGKVFTAATRHDKAGVYETSFDFDSEVRRKINDIRLAPLFQMMGEAERVLGKPQYIEWAATQEGDKTKLWIIQIADVDRQQDSFEFEVDSEPFLEAHSITGTGTAECSSILIARSYTAARAIGNYNETHKDYILVYSSTLTSRGSGLARLQDHARDLSYSDLSNARVILESQNMLHNENPLAHFQGQLDMTHKFFGILEANSMDGILDLVENAVEIEDGVFEIQLPVRVVASERQNKLLVLPIS